MSLGHTASQAVSGVVTCLQKCVIYLVDIFIWSIYFLQLKTHCPAPRAHCHQSQGGSRTRLSSSLGLLVPQGWKGFRCHSLHCVVSCQFLWLTRTMLYFLLLDPIQTLGELIIIPLTGARLRPVFMKTSGAGRRNSAFSNIPFANCYHHPLWLNVSSLREVELITCLYLDQSFVLGGSFSCDLF